ncbi:histidine kinase [Clostridium sp. E02]|uniref:sensor histidine kinase n=1 Tax=Clostridium sp. E02 TaxID=2487134 RepID=UPI000F52889C|nr:histidine kinase [Clostridium sp. E02]
MENRIHFRNTLYFKMIAVTAFLGLSFLIALVCIYKVSSNWFRTEISDQSDTLTEQICRNVEISLKELGDNTLPLTATNQRFGSLIGNVEDTTLSAMPYLRIKIRKHLEEMISVNYNINWIAVIDDREDIYFACRGSRSQESMPPIEDIDMLYHDNWDNLSNPKGNTVWAKSKNEEGILLLRLLFDEDTMRFCGGIVAEVKNTPLKAVFNHIDSTKVGDFTLYDQNNNVLFHTYGEGSTGLIENDDENYLHGVYGIENGRLKIVHQINLENKNKRYLDFLYLILAVGILLFLSVILFLWFMFGNMAKNLNIMFGNINRVSRGEFEMEPALFAKGDELYVLDVHIQEMASRIKTLMQQVVEAKELQQQNEYKLLEFRYHELQAQINPHFLYNILQSINGIAQINEDRQVSRLICLLSKFFRGSIERTNSCCEVSKELEYAKNYLELCKNIYPDRLCVQWDVDDTLLNVMVPSCILQPIVENSLVHGMEPKMDRCTIKISVYRDGGKLILCVWDDGEGILPEQLSVIMENKKAKKRIGVKNVLDRIQLMYGKEYGLLIQSEFQKYTQVKLLLPLDRM